MNLVALTPYKLRFFKVLRLSNNTNGKRGSQVRRNYTSKLLKALLQRPARCSFVLTPPLEFPTTLLPSIFYSKEGTA